MHTAPAHESRSKQLLGVGFVCLAVGIILGMSFHKETVVVREGTPDTPAAMTSVNLMIDDASSTVRTWNTITWHEAMSVLGLMETVSGAHAITMLTKKVGADSTVESINGIANNSATNMRWQYWVNNTYEPSIASKYFLKPGDIVVWKYTKEQSK